MIYPVLTTPLPMARALHHSLLSQMRGKFGDFVVKHYGDKVVITRVPKFTKGWSKGQEQHRGQFSKASDYAKAVQRSPEKSASYANWAKKLKRTVRSVAMSDFMTLPALLPLRLESYTGEVGSMLDIGAVKRFKVTGIDLEIRTPKGRVLERGPAKGIDRQNQDWTYRGTQALKGQGDVVFEAIATDRFGRTASQVAKKTL
jgi:hypothetical protein